MGVLTKELEKAQAIIKAQQAIDESKSAQLVIQSMELIRLKESLRAKEEKRKEKHGWLKTKGLGMHMTDPGFIDAIEQEARDKEQKEKDKKQRGEVRKSKRAAREQCEAEWKLIKEEHERATEAWKLECERLKSDGVRPKDLPTKPKRPAKPKPVVEDEEDDDKDNSSDEEGM